MLKMTGVSIELDGQLIASDVDISIQKGEFVSLIGPNGSGKSTLIKSISNLIDVAKGRITLLEIKHTDYHLKKLAQTVSTMAQHHGLIEEMTVYDRVAYGRLPYRSVFQPMSHEDRIIVADILEDVGLTELKDKKITNLSGGELQRVYLAASLAQAPDLLILDEPTNHLDVLHQYKLLSLVKRLSRDRNIAVLCVLHDMNQAIKYADKLLMMKDGRLVTAGHAKEVVTEKRIKDVFGIDCKVYNESDYLHVNFIYES